MTQSRFVFGDARPLAGVDEAGRGPLAGPVVAGAVILNPDEPIAGLADSKILSASRRSELADEILRRSLAWSVAWADPAEIDRLNILQATLLAMRRAILGLRIRPGYVVVDGNRLPDLRFFERQLDGDAVVGGDARIPAISAASIIAKVRRDEIMRAMDTLYPEYGFSRHKGYATADHRDRLGTYGPCPEHRRSFSRISTLKGDRQQD
jgi:ribonuclease HII